MDLPRFLFVVAVELGMRRDEPRRKAESVDEVGDGVELSEEESAKMAVLGKGVRKLGELIEDRTGGVVMS